MSSGPPGVGNATLPRIDPNTPGLDHGSSAYVLIITTVLCLTFATLSVAGRVYTRQAIVNDMWIDDYFAVIACMLLCAMGITLCIQTRDGIGSHIWDVPSPEGLLRFQKAMWTSLLLYNISVFFTKLMFFLQYYRMVQQIRKLKIIYAVIMGLVTIWSISQIFITAFARVPSEGLWDPTVATTGNIVTDLIIILLPLPVVWRLTLPTSQNCMLAGIFSLGFFTCVVASFKLILLRDPVDLTYDAVGITCWKIAEVASGVICAALPTLRPLLGRYFPAFGTHAQAFKGYQIGESGWKPKSWGCARHSRKATDIKAHMGSDLEIELERPYPVKLRPLQGAQHGAPRVSVPSAAYRAYAV